MDLRSVNKMASDSWLNQAKRERSGMRESALLYRRTRDLPFLYLALFYRDLSKVSTHKANCYLQVSYTERQNAKN